MATIHGVKGSVYVGTTKIAQTTSWTVNEIQETAEARIHEQDWVLREPGMRDWNASVEGLADTDTGTDTFVQRIASAGGTTVGDTEVVLQLRQTTGTAIVYQGTCIMTDFSQTAPVDGIETFSATFAGNGRLLYS